MKKKAFVALALSATLAMGVTPAFAADGDGSASTPTGVDKTKGTGNTTVSVQTIATNISATIPLNVTVVGPAEGGDLSGVPTNYEIVNNSVYPIKVTEVKADMTGITGWKLQANKLTTASTTTGTIGDLNLSIKPAKGTAWTVSETANKPTDWVVAAKTADKGTAENLALSGSVSPIKSVEKDATSAVKIQYTVQPTTATTTP